MQAARLIAIFLSLFPEILQIDIAILCRLDRQSTFQPAMWAEAGLVPWAEVGMRQTSRWASPRGNVIVADGQ